MILMANGYVGYEITKFLVNKGEKIEYFVYTSSGDESFNERIIKALDNTTEIYSNDRFLNGGVLDRIRCENIDLGILAWWPHIISEEVISVTKRGFVNTHPAYLPYNRGKHPYFWTIVDGTPFGATIHYVNKDIDAGKIIVQKQIGFDWSDTGETLYRKARDTIVDLFKENYEEIKNNNLIGECVNIESGTIHYGSDLAAICTIDLDKAYRARDLFNILRGRMFRGEGECFFFDQGKRYCVSIKIIEKPDKES